MRTCRSGTGCDDLADARRRDPARDGRRGGPAASPTARGSAGCPGGCRAGWCGPASPGSRRPPTSRRPSPTTVRQQPLTAMESPRLHVLEHDVRADAQPLPVEGVDLPEFFHDAGEHVASSVLLRCRSEGSGAWQRGRRGRRRKRRDRVATCGPAPIRTVTVGPGISPDRPHPQLSLAWGSRAFTAGRELHPTPQGVFSCRSRRYQRDRGGFTVGGCPGPRSRRTRRR